VTDRLIGYIGISVPTFLPDILPAVEVGWRFDPEAWGRGYASEGAREVLIPANSRRGEVMGLLHEMSRAEYLAEIEG